MVIGISLLLFLLVITGDQNKFIEKYQWIIFVSLYVIYMWLMIFIG